MAYNSTYGLTRIAFMGYSGDATSPGNPGTQKSLWSYVINDSAATVEAAGYFNAAAALGLAVGDVIKAVMAVNSTPVLKTYVVTVATTSTITIALQTTTAG